MLLEAVEYAKRGWYVFPCREKPGATFVRNGIEVTPVEKTPYVANGLNDATLDLDQIKAWWTKWENAMIGVNAGKSGLFVIDIDKKHVNGLDTFTTWDINDTAGLHSMTPSGGIHIIFTGTGKSSTNAKTGIDTRGEGGYFIAPPSRILDGEYAGEYKTIDAWDRTPGVIPDGLMSKLFPESTTEYVRGNTTTPLPDGVTKQLSRRTLLFLANGAPAGERNNDLFKVFADFKGCGYTKEHAREAATPMATKIGLPAYEIEQVLEHAYAKDRTSSIPDSVQEKMAQGDKNLTSKITPEEEIIIEDIVLACMIVNNTLIPIVQDILTSDDFQAIKNRIIYRAIAKLHAQGKKIDSLILGTALETETDKVTLSDIVSLSERYYANTDNIADYANIIKEKSSIRKLESLLDNKEKYLGGSNFNEIISSVEKDISDIAIYGGAKSTNILSSFQATEFVAEQTRLIQSGAIQQLKIGFAEYDFHVGGLFSTDMVICAARAGDGKSAMALSILNHVSIVKGIPAMLFSLEMSTHETICRLICQLTGLPFRDVYQGKLSEAEWVHYEKAMQTISKSPLFFDDGFGMTVPEIRSKIRKMVEQGIKLVVIDQLEQIKGYEGQPAYIQFDKIAYDIKNFTKEFEIPIILNHQLNRGITDRKLKNPEPQLSDLNQAGEKPATQVWVISHHKDDRGKILQSKIKILKNRNGPRMDFPVVYVGERMLFSTPTRDEDRTVFTNDDDYVNIDDGVPEEPEWAV